MRYVIRCVILTSFEDQSRIADYGVAAASGIYILVEARMNTGAHRLHTTMSIRCTLRAACMSNKIALVRSRSSSRNLRLARSTRRTNNRERDRRRCTRTYEYFLSDCLECSPIIRDFPDAVFGAAFGILNTRSERGRTFHSAD